MNPLAALFFKLARRLIPRTVRMRLNKYRGPGLAARLKLGRDKNPTVLSGPFKGLRYPAYGIGSEYFPKIVDQLRYYSQDKVLFRFVRAP